MAKKKINQDTFIDVELDWAENQLHTWKEYVDKNPLHELTDRIHYKETKGGGVMPMISATIESQGKFIQDTMKNYLTLLSLTKDLRQKEAARKEAVGGRAVSGIWENNE